MDEKDCVICNEIKPVSEFYKDVRMRTGYSSECKPCRRIRNKQWQADNYVKKKRMPPKRYHKPNGHVTDDPSHKRNLRLQKTYGITVDDYDRQYQLQNGLCAICKEYQEKLFVDHCHNTDVVRGLICHRCNVGLGYFRDNVEFMENAIKYLNSNGSWNY